MMLLKNTEIILLKNYQEMMQSKKILSLINTLFDIAINDLKELKIILFDELSTEKQMIKQNETLIGDFNARETAKTLGRCLSEIFN